MGFANNVVPGFLLRKWVEEEKEMEQAIAEKSWSYRGGGLMRCCIATIENHNAPGVTDGEILLCQDGTEMGWVEAGRYWQWKMPEEMKKSYDLFMSKRGER